MWKPWGTMSRRWSLGPDLFYYSSLPSAGIDLLTDGSVQAKGPEPWSYELHSLTPNRLEGKTGPDYDSFKQDFRQWANCVRGPTLRNTEDSFRY